MVAEVVDYVVGVDTHRDGHTLALVEAASGAVLAQRAVASNGRGYAQALRFAQQQAGDARLWAVEGAGHYGAGLARYLSERGETVLEVGRSPRGERRLRGKDDQLDAVRAARAALRSEPLPRPRSGERREALRLLLVARRGAVDVRREALVQLRSVIVTAPDRLREELRGLSLQRLLERCRRLRRSTTATPDEVAVRLVLRTLARRIEAAAVEAEELEREILAHVQALAPALLDEPGVGPIVAAQLLVAWSHRAASAPKPPSLASPASPRSPPPAAKPAGTDSAAAATVSCAGDASRRPADATPSTGAGRRTRTGQPPPRLRAGKTGTGPDRSRLRRTSVSPAASTRRSLRVRERTGEHAHLASVPGKALMRRHRSAEPVQAPDCAACAGSTARSLGVDQRDVRNPSRVEHLVELEAASRVRTHRRKSPRSPPSSGRPQDCRRSPPGSSPT
jgi:transposase